MIYAYNIHNILKIESDISILNEPFHKYFLTEDVSEPDTSIKIYKDFDIPKNGLSRHDLWFYGYGKEGEDFVYCMSSIDRDITRSFVRSLSRSG